MKRLFRRLAVLLLRDDLFVRVCCAIFGVASGAMGTGLLIVLFVGPVSSTMALILGLVLGLLLLGVAIAFFLRSVVSLKTHLGMRLNRVFPDAGSFEGLIFLVAVLLFPAAVFTIVMRCIGIRGQRPWMKSLLSENASSSKIS